MKHRTNGFTIVELLIVIVIIAILAAISIVAYNGFQNRAYDTTVQSDLKQLGQKLQLYSTERDTYPNSAQLASALDGFRATKTAYAVSPTTNHNLAYCFPSNYSTYIIVALSKSGNMFSVAPGQGVKSQASSSSVTASCQETMGASYASNYRGYAGEDNTTGPWRTWTGGS